MSKQPSKTLIGVFVTGAIVLIVLAILILGSGKCLTQTHDYVMFFKG